MLHGLLVMLLMSRVEAAAPAAPATDIQTQTEELQRKRKAAAELEKTEEKSAQRQVPSGERPVSYADILRDPDNVDLNYRYALGLIGKGNLRGASATLERITLIDPSLAKVHLLYGVVLFRLDNLNDAENELV